MCCMDVLHAEMYCIDVLHRLLHAEMCCMQRCASVDVWIAGGASADELQICIVQHAEICNGVRMHANMYAENAA